MKGKRTPFVAGASALALLAGKRCGDRRHAFGLPPSESRDPTRDEPRHDDDHDHHDTVERGLRLERAPMPRRRNGLGWSSGCGSSSSTAGF